MKVKERLQHGNTFNFVLPVFVLFNAILVVMPVLASGQIIEAANPYDSTTAPDSVARPALEQPATATALTAPQSDQLQLAYLRIRQFIAQGNTTEAERYLAMIPENSPGILGDDRQSATLLINHQKHLAQLRAQKAAGFDEEAVQFLLAQARDILKYRDFATAETLVNQAKLFRVDFSKLPISPQSVSAAIAQAKSPVADPNSPASQLMGLMSQAQLAFDKSQFQQARELVMQAQQLGVPANQLPKNQTLPWQLDLKIQDAMKSQGQVIPVNFEKAANENVVQADYYPETDTTRNVTVASNTPEPVPTAPPAPVVTTAMQQYQSGVQALQRNDKAAAKQYFSAAWRNRQELDAAAEQAVEEQLRSLIEPIQPGQPASNNSLEQIAPADSLNPANGFSPPANALEQEGSSFRPPTQTQNEPIQSPLPTQQQSSVQAMSRDLATDAAQEQLFRRLQSEVFRQRSSAEQLGQTSPHEAISTLTELRSKITNASITEQGKRALLNFVDRDISVIQKYIQTNLSDIQLAEDNASRMESLNDEREAKYNTELQIQKLVEDFDDLVDEQRYAEANMVAKQAIELDPNSEIATLLRERAAIQMNVARSEANREDKAETFLNQMHRADEASVVEVDELNPMKFRNVDQYARDAKRRAAWLDERQYDSQEERQIWNILKNEKVQGNFQGTLADAIGELSEQSGVNILFDNPALAASSISSESTINMPFNQPITLQSALNIILGSSGLVFVVEDEVVKVTSREAQRRDVEPKTFYVGDLVVPIQNFSQSLSMNFLSPANSYGANGIIGQSGAVPLAQNGGQAISPLDIAAQSAAATSPDSAFSQQLGGLGGLGSGRPFAGSSGGSVQRGTPTYGSIGPQSLGGVTEADFQPLISLIRNSIDPEGWDDTNGDGTIQAFVPNLSLIVSQTQEVQDQIQDLLNQLRDLNDVQIVVEVRFVSLNDGFFERIGIDFDFDLNDNSGFAGVIPDEVNDSSVVGISTSDANPTFNPDLDLGFRQGSILESTPLFGGFTPGSAASFGFAILSDIEVFFLLNAVKGDARTNVTQAPTVTMFNGQVATVNDGALVPFVTSVIPVVGDFAVAQQPVITLLPEGASLNVQATVSNDRKSVRLSLVPFFSQITEVQTFTFDGSTSTQRASDNSLLDDLIGLATTGETDGEEDPVELETTSQGVTVQLPTLGFTSVSTVVSVPDGGTILIGGVKRQSEQRVERGVPFLSNIPYISRLFKNVGIGRDTQSLMMMVSPKIIIQEEEELDQVGTTRN